MKKLDWLILLGALLLSFGFGAARLDADIIFVDEYWSLRNSGAIFGPLDLLGIWERTAELDPAGMGVFYYGLIGAWAFFIGNSEFALRSFSLFAGVLAIASLYPLGRKLFSARTGLYASVILASSAFFIDYLHEGRAYSLIVFLSAFALYSYLQIMQNKATVWYWYPCLSLALAALAYTHYVALSMGLVLGCIHLLKFQRTRKWFFVLLAMLVGGLLYLPWLNVALEVIGRGAEDTGRQVAAMTTWQIIESLFHSFSNANLAFLGLFALYSFQKFKQGAWLLWLYLLIGLLAVLLVNQLIPFMLHIRYLIFVWPALALIMAVGMERMQAFGKAALLIFFILGFYHAWQGEFINALTGHVYRAPMPSFRLALETLDERAVEGDMALFHIIPPEREHLNFFPLAFYMEFPPLDRLSLAYEQFERVANSTANGDNDYFVDVNRVFETVTGVWTMRNPQLPFTQKSGVVDFVLRSQFMRCETVFERDDMQMSLYLRPPQGEAIGSFGDQNLSLFNMGRGYQNERFAHFVLAWESDLAGDSYSVALHLFDMAGNFVRQYDFPLPNERPSSCVGVSFPIENLPSGVYPLNVIVYHWQTGERLLANTGEDHLTFASIEIP